MARLLFFFVAAVVALCPGSVIHVEAQRLSGCTSSALSLTPCLNYFTGSSNGSTSSSPNQQCCDAVAEALNVGVECLCQLVTTSNPLGFINRTIAFRIPGLCRIQSEPLNQCEESAGVPFAEPTASPGSNLAPSPAPEMAPVAHPARSPAEEFVPSPSPSFRVPATEAPSGLTIVRNPAVSAGCRSRGVLYLPFVVGNLLVLFLRFVAW